MLTPKVCGVLARMEIKMKNKGIIYIVLLCFMMTGCSVGDLGQTIPGMKKSEDSCSFRYDDENILGLEKITQSSTKITLVFDDKAAKKAGSPTQFYAQSEEEGQFRDPVCKSGEEKRAVHSSTAYLSKGKIYVEIECEDAMTVEYVAIGNVVITNPESPQIKITYDDGEISSVLFQNYYSEHKKWSDPVATE